MSGFLDNSDVDKKIPALATKTELKAQQGKTANKATKVILKMMAWKVIECCRTFVNIFLTWKPK